LAAELAQQFEAAPLAAIVYTDIAMDGMLAGPNLSAMAGMRRATSLPVVASGGITSANDIKQLAALGMAGCIVGRALYEDRLTLADAIAAAAA
jgi:phosphoribosylformimino-5-aminoimidazole carboxamide ribotide isomerase